MQKLKVQLRNGFSDRNKIKQENTMLQVNDFDERTRVGLINVTDAIMVSCKEREHNSSKVQMILKCILTDLYVQEIEWDDNYREDVVFNAVKQSIREDSYDDVLTVIEYIANLLDKNYYKSDIFEWYNNVLEKEYVGYRFVNKKITKITDDIEIQEIENVNKVEIDSVKEHINKSLAHLSNRTNPDYENSIKESISAVEAMCNSIVGKGTLGQTLHKLEQNGVVIHGALKGAFSQLYGWTSDANGIRHAGDIGGVSSTFDEAKFMLVSCCAFINYLKSSLKD